MPDRAVAEVLSVRGRLPGYPFLLKKHAVSYSYSASLLREMSEKSTAAAAPSGTLLAMASFFEGKLDSIFGQLDSLEMAGGWGLRDAILPLPLSGLEVATSAKIWDGEALAGAGATAENFRQLAPRFRILHLATHAKADDRQGDYAWVAFFSEENRFEKLYARDLYAMQVPADLVILSACETGIGKLRRGEGIISLARAFSYAGAKSIVTSLWSVRDDSSQKLMENFHYHLKNGGNKDVDLQKAKLELIKNGYDNPFYWAGLIGVGNMGALR